MEILEVNGIKIQVEVKIVNSKRVSARIKNQILKIKNGQENKP